MWRNVFCVHHQEVSHVGVWETEGGVAHCIEQTIQVWGRAAVLGALLGCRGRNCGAGGAV